MSTHTPGPWQYRLETGDIVIETQPHAEDVAVIHSVATGILGGRLDNSNARLIAAAPELLKAANGALEFACAKWFKGSRYEPEWVRALRSAIAKAEG